MLDNCIGSGTTAIAAIRTGRHYIGSRLNRRIAKLSDDGFGRNWNVVMDKESEIREIKK